MNASPDRPVIFHIGLHKTGTSSLQSDCFIPENGYLQPKSRHWILKAFVNKAATEGLSADEHRELISVVETAHKDGLIPVISHERLSGYPLSGAYDRVSILHRIQSTGLNVKIVYVIREQKSWLFSAWKQLIGDNEVIRLTDFLHYGADDRSKYAYPRLENLNYHRDILYLQTLFGAENVYALPMEGLLADYQRFLDGLADLTGHDRRAPASAALTNVNPSDRSYPLLAMYIMNRFLLPGATRSYGRPESHHIVKARKIASNFLKNHLPDLPFSQRIVDKQKAMIEDAVGDYYCDINKRTSDLLGIDLSQYGYEVRGQAEAKDLK